MIDFSLLNPEQRAAAEHVEGPLLVFAGAGSGKTRVITYRIANLIQNHRVYPGSILAVTFTNKAAAEMKSRLGSLLGDQAKGLWVGTFHAICARLLRESGRVIGVEPNFLVYDDSDQVDVIKQVLKSLDIDEKQFPARQISYAISRAKEKLLGPEEFEKKAFEFFDRVVARVYPRYQEALQLANALDFDDLLLKMIQLLQHDAQILERYQDRFRYILIDEYQDVNYAQYVLVQLLAKKHHNLCVVGDDDQSIYSFRGAEVELILRFQKDYPEATIIRLEQNYRSTQPILDAAFSVVSQNRSRAPKRLWTEREEGMPLTLTRAQDDADEAQLVADYLQRQVLKGDRTYGDFAVLYRTNAQSRAFEDTFRRNRIPHRIVGALRFYDRKEIKDLLAYLRLIVNPDDAVSFRRVINAPPRGIGAQTQQSIQAHAAIINGSLWDACQDEMFLKGLSPRAKQALRHFTKMIEELRQQAHSLSVTALVKSALERSGYWHHLQMEGTTEARDRIENLMEFMNVVAVFEETSEDKTLLAFLQNASLVSDMDSVQEQGNEVLLMTLHTSKGLEFPVVFLVGVENGILPHSRSETPRDIEEERRLCYVGMTRARDELHILYAQARRVYGDFRWSQPSPFLKALPEEDMIPLHRVMYSSSSAYQGISPAILRALSRDESDPNAETEAFVEESADLRDPVSQESSPFLPGQRVNHAKFGFGIVIRTEAAAQGDFYVTVMFSGTTGLKTILASTGLLKGA